MNDQNKYCITVLYYLLITCTVLLLFLKCFFNCCYFYVNVAYVLNFGICLDLYVHSILPVMSKPVSSTLLPKQT